MLTSTPKLALLFACLLVPHALAAESLGDGAYAVGMFNPVATKSEADVQSACMFAIRSSKKLGGSSLTVVEKKIKSLLSTRPTFSAVVDGNVLAGVIGLTNTDAVAVCEKIKDNLLELLPERRLVTPILRLLILLSKKVNNPV